MNFQFQKHFSWGQQPNFTLFSQITTMKKVSVSASSKSLSASSLQTHSNLYNNRWTKDSCILQKNYFITLNGKELYAIDLAVHLADNS